jgi:hypothetical protein
VLKTIGESLNLLGVFDDGEPLQRGIELIDREIGNN